MEYIQQNWPWAALAAASGAMLLFDLLKAGDPSQLGAIDATLKINREDALIVDLRTSDEFVRGHIPNARHIPLADLEKRSAELRDGERPVILCCATGARSAAALATLRKAGIEHAFNLAGGLQAWERAGQPLAKGKKRK